MRYIALPENIETKVFVLDSNALTETPKVLQKYFPGRKVQIVADGNTWRVAGEKVQALCRAAGLQEYEPIILPAEPKPHPDYALSQLLAEKFAGDCVPVAVGSGVINDLVKCASEIKKLRYCCVATAPSVDGYTASGGAMAVAGQKKTVPCPAPYALIADRNILKTAPRAMMAAGYADLMSKITGGADWIIADALKEDPIRDDVWQLIQGNIRSWVADPADMQNIFAGLAATGYAMQMYKDSRPASGAEHLFSHVWEMEGLTMNGEDISHGFKVGIGLLASTLLHEFILENEPVDLPPAPTRSERKAEIAALLKRGCYGSAPEETAMKKFREGDAIAARRAEIVSVWKDLQQRLRKQIIPYAVLKKMLLAANCPVTPAEIGLDAEQFLHGIRTAQLIRIRYTVLDLLYETGLLEQALKKLDVML